MLDRVMRRLIDPALDRAGRSFARRGASADGLTFAGLGLGILACVGLAAKLDGLAVALIVANRLLDGLDGAVARATEGTDRGGFIDIVFDFAFYGGVPLAFAIRDPGANAVAAAVLLFSFYVNGASFLAFAAVAAKRRLDVLFADKSIYFSVGLAEGSETILFFIAMALFPAAFPILAYAFAGLTMMSAVARIVVAWHAFRDYGDNQP